MAASITLDISRHCEERQRRSNPVFVLAGLLRFARNDGSMTPRTATLIGLTAILMWSLLAVMTVATGTIPAFQLAAMTFAIGALVGSLTWIGRPEAIGAL